MTKSGIRIKDYNPEWSIIFKDLTCFQKNSPSSRNEKGEAQ